MTDHPQPPASAMQRRAVIDIGTNSVRLLVAELSRGGRGDVDVAPIMRAIDTPRLGRGVDRHRRLNREAIQATAAVVCAFAEQARSAGAEVIDVIGTSALRDAVNRDDFVGLLHRRCGLAVRVIDGREEAELSFFGAVRGVHADAKGAGAVYVLDVGGGSTELVGGSADGTMESATSVDVGAVRMTELCVRSDPISQADWDCLLSEVRSGLQSLWRSLRSGAALPQAAGQAPRTASSTMPEKTLNPLSLLAVGGTATTLAAMQQRLDVYDPKRVHGFTLSRDDVERLVEALRAAPAEERRRWPGLHPQRADIILAGSVIVLEAMKGLGAAGVTVSESDLLEGVLLRGFHEAARLG